MKSAATSVERSEPGWPWGVIPSLLLHLLAAVFVLSTILPETASTPPVIDLSLLSAPGEEAEARPHPPSGGMRGTRAGTAPPAPFSAAPEPDPPPSAAPEPAPPQAPSAPPVRAATPPAPADPLPPAGGDAPRRAENDAYRTNAPPSAPADIRAPSGPASGAAARVASAPGLAAAEGPDPRGPGRGAYIERNYAYLRDAIQRRIVYPPVARKMGWEGKVVVTFLIRADGTVRNVRVVRGSGYAVLDRGAVEAVRDASPFPRPPSEAEIITPVVYRLE